MQAYDVEKSSDQILCMQFNGMVELPLAQEFVLATWGMASDEKLFFNTSFSLEIENEKLRWVKYLDKKSVSFCDMCRFGLRNGTFWSAIWPVLQGETAHIASCFWPKNTVFDRFSADIGVPIIAQISPFSHNARVSQ